jgi:hypothetical protein
LERHAGLPADTGQQPRPACAHVHASLAAFICLSTAALVVSLLCLSTATLQGWEEGQIAFQPTYKYHLGCNVYSCDPPPAGIKAALPSASDLTADDEGACRAAGPGDGLCRGEAPSRTTGCRNGCRGGGGLQQWGS